VLTANVAWNDGDINDFDDTRILLGGTGALLGLDCISLGGALDVCQVDRSDEDLSRLAEFSYYVSAHMLFPMGNGTLVPQLSYCHRDGVEYCRDRGSCLSGIYNQDRKDLAANLTWSNDNWRVRLWAKT
jgi:hypothetical protein|tara:strand:+ start:599 stop:985 length:387 start_codon:yes stop_codon:yes gene_type:complete